MELLASKVFIQEEAPRIPAVIPIATGTGLIEGICERGPINDPQLVTSEDEYERIFGGFTTTGTVATSIHGFFNAGGQRAWVNRIVHYTDLANPAAHIALKGQVMILNAGSLATAGSLTGTLPAPYNFLLGVRTLDISTNGGGPTTVTFTGTAAPVTDTTVYPVVAGVGSMTVKIDRGIVQTITFAGTETTAADIAATINGQLIGGRAYASGGQVVIESDTLGTDSYVQVVANPGAAPLLTFPLGEVQGTGNVGTLAAVDGTEVKTAVELAVADVEVTVGGTGLLTFATDTTGATKWIRIEATSGLDDEIGLDNLQHFGTDATPQNTLQIDGKYFGAYTAAVQVVIAAASSGVATEFNLQVLKSGVVSEVFPNLDTDTVEDIVNHVSFGSHLIAVTSLQPTGAVATDRPVNGTTAYMAGGNDGLTGLAEADYIGNAAGPTGLRAFDRIIDGRILWIPGADTATLHKAMMDYAEVTREGSINMCVLDPPAGQTAAQMVTFVDGGGLVNYSEYGALYWPRIKITNPSTTVYGSDNEITVPPSGCIAGLYARNDGRPGGIYESPAGTGLNYGVIPGMTGVEDDPTGLTFHEVVQEAKRNLVYPKRINPITKMNNTPWHIDGGRTLKATGNFPNVSERRGVCFIKESIKEALVVFKHRQNTADNRWAAKRMITAFLNQQTALNAFRSTNPDDAFFVDTSDQLNPLVNQYAGIMTIRIGLATNKPMEYIVVLITQDTRALQEELAASQQ